MASLRTLLGLLGSLVYPQKLWNGSEQSSSCTSTRLLCTSSWQMTPFPIPNYIWPYFLTKHIRGSLIKLNDPLKPSNYKLYKDNSIIKCQQFRNASDLNINAPLYQIPRENLKFKDWISSPSQSSKKLMSIIKFSCFYKLKFTEIRLILFTLPRLSARGWLCQMRIPSAAAPWTLPDGGIPSEPQEFY